MEKLHDTYMYENPWHSKVSCEMIYVKWTQGSTSLDVHMPFTVDFYDETLLFLSFIIFFYSQYKSISFVLFLHSQHNQSSFAMRNRHQLHTL
jgi:hypothetical protein